MNRFGQVEAEEGAAGHNFVQTFSVRGTALAAEHGRRQRAKSEDRGWYEVTTAVTLS